MIDISRLVTSYNDVSFAYKHIMHIHLLLAERLIQVARNSLRHSLFSAVK